MTLLIRNGTLITASETFNADIYVVGERIQAIGTNLLETIRASVDGSHDEGGNPGEAGDLISGVHIIDASGKLIFPGGVDPHTHFDLPMFDTVSSDDHYTGHKAAAFGGTTTVIDFVPQEPGSLVENIHIWQAKAAKAAIDYSFHMNITRLNDQVKAEIPSLPDLGLTSIKVFTAYNNHLRLSDGEIFLVLRMAAENGLLTLYMPRTAM